MNKHLFEWLRRIEKGARRLASTITSSGEARLRDVTLVRVELEEIANALEAFKSEIAAGASSIGSMPGRLIKEWRRINAIYQTVVDPGMFEHNPEALSDAMGTCKHHLGSTKDGAEALDILENRKGGTIMSMECFTFDFRDQSRGDFERLLESPYIERLKEAVSHIAPNVKLHSRDFETGVEHEVLFEHTAEGSRVRRTPENIKNI